MCVPIVFWERSYQNQGIGNRNDDQNNEMEQLRFRGKVRIIRKRTERIDSSMDDDAGEQASAEIKDCNQQEANCNCKDNLAQIVDQIHTAAIEQVNDMSDTKNHTGDNNGGFDIILCN